MARKKITPRDVERFTEGDCHIFAAALSDRTGWPTYAFTELPYSDYNGLVSAGPTAHAFCVLPDGRCADIEGVWNPTDFKHRWVGCLDLDYEALDFFPVEKEECRKMWGEEFGHYSHRRARELAPLIEAMA